MTKFSAGFENERSLRVRCPKGRETGRKRALEAREDRPRSPAPFDPFRPLLRPTTQARTRAAMNHFPLFVLELIEHASCLDR